MTEQTPEYITEALQMAGIDLSAPKKIVQEVSGFTPLFDCVVEKYHDETRAAVHGAVWRFCQMEDGVCKASLDTIGKMLGVSSATVMRHIEALCNDGYFVDLTPDLRNKPHVYADGGKVVMKSKLTASVSQRNASVSQRNASVSQRNASVSESQLNKDINKDSNKQTPPLSIENAIAINQPVTHDMLKPEEHNAQREFERAFGFGELPWDSTQTWQKFKKFVVSVYQSTPRAFAEYVQWREGDGKYRAFSNKKIRETPAAFMDTGWPEFLTRHISTRYNREQKPGRSIPQTLERDL